MEHGNQSPVRNYFSRRAFLAGMSAAVLAGAGCRGENASKGPNVLFIAVDDLNDWVGRFGGHPGVKTPNIDRLASRGVCFQRAYCPAPVCNASRVATMTGLQPTSTGIYENLQIMRETMPDVVTLPQAFMAAGYDALAGGKIYHGGLNDAASWQQYFEMPLDPLPQGRPLNGIELAKTFDWGPLDVPDEAMGDFQVVDWVIARLLEERSKPFFLGAGLFKPHVPLFIPRKYFDLFPIGEIQVPDVNPDDLNDVPEFGRKLAEPNRWHKAVVDAGQWKQAVQGYLAAVAFADAQVGRLLDALDHSAHADDTIVVFFGDNGWHLGEKLHWHKLTLWEESARVPLIISVPGMTSRGQDCFRTVSLVDLYPTLLQLCDLPAHELLEGRSLVPLLENPEASWDRPALTVLEPGSYAIRSEQWRYIRYRDGSEELYDHDSDPKEWVNLAGDVSHEGIKAELAKWMPDHAADPATVQKKTWKPR